jgi:putative FmdB family regulatory protein
MPVYEYECPKCGEKFELRRNIADKDSDISCPKCGAKAPKRILSLFSTTFPGGSCTPSSHGAPT